MILGAWFRLVHDLVWHEFMGVSLWRWLLLLVLLAAALAGFSVLPGGLWLGAALALVFLALVLSRRWAQARFHVVFRPDGDAAGRPPAPAPMAPADKARARATGLLGVEGREAPWTELQAYYRTFATGEHAIMARRTPSRFLSCGERDPETLGMWYLFLTADTLRAVTPGVLLFGTRPRPALRLHYMRTTPKGKSVSAVAYLSFDAEADRRLVWGDLLPNQAGRLARGPISPAPAPLP